MNTGSVVSRCPPQGFDLGFWNSTSSKENEFNPESMC